MGEGAGIFCENSDLIFQNCLIIGNVADKTGGGMHCEGSTTQMINCTFSGNSGVFGAGIYCHTSELVLRNTIVEGSIGGKGVYFAYSSNSSFTYCDFYNNSSGNFIGSGPSGLGTLVSTNAKGDSCDIYSNIFEDPLFVDLTNGDFHLQAGSSCIDAGDPNSPLDPDGTCADIGAFYFDQGSIAPVAVTLTPENPPIILPGSGGSFNFNIAIANNLGVAQTFDIWTMVTLPDGREYGPIIGPINLTLNPGVSIDRDRSQAVGFGAPSGAYTYDAYVGTYPDDIIDEDHFDFTKLAVDNGGPVVPEWANWGESFEDATVSGLSVSPNEFALHPAYPNPFNPVTNLTFCLPNPGYVSLIIYDVKGREVACLIDGFQPAGLYESTFNASDLPSGIYFACLTAGNFHQTQKLLLVK